MTNTKTDKTQKLKKKITKHKNYQKTVVMSVMLVEMSVMLVVISVLSVVM